MQGGVGGLYEENGGGVSDEVSWRQLRVDKLKGRLGGLQLRESL